MKLIIFAGGIGTRLWPLSRENFPKQFNKIFSGKSTLELAIERVKPVFGLNNIFIQTIANFKDVVKEQIPGLAEENIIIEPGRRNLAPAVCLSVLEFKKRGLSGPMAILWADHLMDNPREFVKGLKVGEKLIKEDAGRFVFLAERPRFANNNLGWIKAGENIGKLDDVDYFSFQGWKYKPSMEECNQMFKQGKSFWNPGYFITSIEFLLDQYKTLAPGIYKDVSEGNYLQAQATHFDRAIIEKVDLSNAVVIKTNMGWSDPGTLYALKEALEKSKQDNVIQGQVTVLNTDNSLIYNLENGKLVTAVGLKGTVVVNTPDALVVVSKDEVVNITNLVKKLKEEGKGEYL
ncbi:MAG: sugar phosphate nucleotidyltransferase [Patescibacteria group bacterium]|nr:sugar phosphate nucleotidyltransferase [Patescibacteria group bacterium]